MKEFRIILKTDNGYIFNFYTWAVNENDARDRAKKCGDLQILGSEEI